MGAGAMTGARTEGVAVRPDEAVDDAGSEPEALPLEPRGTRVGWFVRRAGVVVVASALAVVGLLYVRQDSRIYGPPDGIAPIEAVLPGGEAVSYAAEDGLVLPAWFLPATGPSTGWTAVLFHGSWSTRASMADDARALADHGIAVLLAEYRGFGDAGGEPSEEGLLLDGAAAATYVRSRPDVDATKVLYVGYSLGTGVAVDVAVSSPPAALVLLAPYTSLPDVAWNELPGLPYRLLMRTQLDSLDRIPGVRSPLLVVRGDRDHLIPPEQSARLFDAANEPKALVTIADAGHDLRGPSGPTTVEATVAFVEQLPAA
jgi:uncharacterized protein